MLGQCKTNICRRDSLEEKLQRLQQELQCDPDYLRFLQVQELCRNSGIKTAWDTYLAIDLELCRNRGQRGAGLEQYGAELCFKMIVQDLIEEQSFKEPDFSYQRNIYWWHGNVRVGEIDLVVLYRDTVVAICEMKASCFEIGVAIRQNEGKLSDSTNSIGKRADEPLKCHENTTPRLYFATLHLSGRKTNGGS